MRNHPAKNCSMLELQNVNGCIPSATKIAHIGLLFQTLRKTNG